MYLGRMPVDPHWNLFDLIHKKYTIDIVTNTFYCELRRCTKRFCSLEVPDGIAYYRTILPGCVKCGCDKFIICYIMYWIIKVTCIVNNRIRRFQCVLLHFGIIWVWTCIRVTENCKVSPYIWLCLNILYIHWESKIMMDSFNVML